MEIEINQILPNPEQPRVEFNREELEGLASSIREHGIIQPLVVEEAENGSYILHDGERRLRAAKMAGLKTVPAHVVPALNGSGGRERLTRALVANIQRSDLNPVEEARAYQRMIDELGMNVMQISRTVGVSQLRIKARLEILKLESSIQNMIITGLLPKDRYAVVALLSLPSEEIRIDLAKRAAKNQMTVNEIVEACARVNEHLAEQSGIEPEQRDIPAIRTAVKRASLNRLRWDALVQIGTLPPWGLVVNAARDTCESCAWFGEASEAICKPCPLPQMLALMIGRSKK